MVYAVTLLALLLPAPAPSATPLKTIVNIKTSAFCGQVHSLAIPFQQIRLRNETIREQMADVAQQLVKRGDSMFDNNWQAMYASQLDMLAMSVAQNLHDADLLLARSWKESPKGVNPKTDALRSSVQDTVDAERALNNAVIVQASYLENANDIQALRSMAATGFGSPRGFQTTIGGPMNRLDANAPPPPLLNRPRAAPASFAQQVGESENAFDLALGEASSACY